jgi:hypothetical protein
MGGGVKEVVTAVSRQPAKPLQPTIAVRQGRDKKYENTFKTITCR